VVRLLEQLPAAQQEALRLKSDEDMVLAQEYIKKGGDYRRAIEIYEVALIVDPGNEAVMAALEQAKADRFMAQERFAQVKKGMAEDEVKALLGQVNLHNIRDYPDKDVKAWFFPTLEDGSAAGVWFRMGKRSGVYEVYQAKYDAVSPNRPAEE